MEKNLKVSKDMTIDSILSISPSKAPLIAKAITNAGLSCVGCGAATWETLEAGMYGHGFEEADIDRLVNLLNEVLEKPHAVSDGVSMTKKAAEKFLEILKAEQKQGWALRFEDKPGGCGGFEYILDFTKAPTEDDLIFESYGAKICVNKKAYERLKGSEIDYLEGLKESGFKVVNPNVKHSCSCGNSQSY